MSRFVLALPLLIGCGGSVVVDEADPFGLAWSAIWIEHKDSDFEEIRVSNVVGLCGKLQVAAEAYKDYEDEVEDIDTDDWCQDAKEPSQDYARAVQGIYGVGARFLFMSVVTEDGDPVVDEDTFEVGDIPALGGVLSYVVEEFITSTLVDWDEDDDFEDRCGVDEVDLDDAYDFWYLDDGTQLEISGLTDTSFAATLEGGLLDADLDSTGDINGSFAPIYCEIDD